MIGVCHKKVKTHKWELAIQHCVHSRNYGRIEVFDELGIFVLCVRVFVSVHIRFRSSCIILLVFYELGTFCALFLFVCLCVHIRFSCSCIILLQLST